MRASMQPAIRSIRIVSIRSIWFHLFSLLIEASVRKKFFPKQKINTQKFDVLFRCRWINFLNYERLFWNPMNAHYFNGCLFFECIDSNSGLNGKLCACSIGVCTGVMPHYGWKTNRSLSQLLHVMSEKIYAIQFVYELCMTFNLNIAHAVSTAQKSYGTFRLLCGVNSFLLFS